MQEINIALERKKKEKEEAYETAYKKYRNEHGKALHEYERKFPFDDDACEVDWEAKCKYVSDLRNNPTTMKQHLESDIEEYNEENPNHKLTISNDRLIHAFDDVARDVFDSMYRANTQRMIEKHDEGVKKQMEEMGFSPQKPSRS